MFSALLAVKFFQILFAEFAKSVQNRYTRVHASDATQLKTIARMVHCELPHFTYIDCTLHK